MPYSYCRTTLYLVLVPAWGTCLLYEYCCTRYIPACCTCLQDYIAALPPRSGKQERTTEGTKSSGGGYCCRLSLLPKCSTPPSRQSSCCAGGSVEETGTFPAPPPRATTIACELDCSTTRYISCLVDLVPDAPSVLPLL